MREKKKLILISCMLIAMFAISSLPQTVNAEEKQDDSDLEVTLHGFLKSSSGELLSDIIQVGEYTNFEQPEFDIKKSDIDLVRYNFSEIQFSNFSDSEIQHNNFSNVHIGENKSYYFNNTFDYSIDAPFDTILNLNITYNSSHANITDTLFQLNLTEDLFGLDYEFGREFKTGENFAQYLDYNVTYEHWDEVIDTKSFTFTDPNFNQGFFTYYHPSKKYYFFDYWTDYVFEFNSDFSSTGSDWALSEPSTQGGGITHNTSHFFVSDPGTDKIFQYEDDWSYSGESYTLNPGGAFVGPSDVLFFNESFYVLDESTSGSSDRVWVYDEHFTYTGNSYEVDEDSKDLLRVRENFVIADTAGGFDIYDDEFNTEGTENAESGYYIAKSHDDHIQFYDYVHNEIYNCVRYNVSKIFQNDTFVLLQANETEQLGAFTKDMINTRVQRGDVINVTILTNSTNTIQLSLYNLTDDLIEKHDLVNGTTQVNVNNDFTIGDYKINATLDKYDYIQFSNLTVFQNYLRYPIEDVWIHNFTYNILGLNYTDPLIKLVKEVDGEGLKNGSYIYRFDSTQFNNYSHIEDLYIPKQQLNFTFNCSEQYSFNYSSFVEYGRNQWRVPSEVDLELNGGDVIDEGYNSGYFTDSQYSSDLDFTADSPFIYFKLNYTTYFSFKFNLDVVSKTYLKKVFELMSDHKIYFTQADLPEMLNIKRFYINNVEFDVDADNEVHIEYPYVSMLPTHIYSMEVILGDDIYLPLEFISNSLGYGSSAYYMEATTNTLNFNDISQYDDIDVDLPADHNATYSNLSFSDMNYKPHYITNNTNNTHGAGYTAPNSSQAAVNYSEQYYARNKNANMREEVGNYSEWSGNNTFNQFIYTNATLNSTGNLSEINANYMTINSTEEGHAFEALEGNDNLTQHSLGDFPDSSTDGEKAWEYYDYSNYAADKYIEIENSHTDSNGLSMGRNLFFYDHDGSYPAESCKLNVDNVTAGKFVFNMLYDGSSSRRFDIKLYGDESTYVQDYRKYLNNFDNGFDGLPAPSNFVNEWVKIEILFECGNGGYNGLSADYSKARLYHYNADTWYEGNEVAFGSDIDNINFLVFGHHSGSYYHDVRLNNMKLTALRAVPCKLNITATNQLNISDDENLTHHFNLSYSHKTDIKQLVNLTAYNFDLNQFDLINSSVNNESFYQNSVILNNSYVNDTHHIRLQFNALNTSNDFLLLVEQLNIKYFNFSVPDAITVNNASLSDTLVVSHQPLKVYWNATYYQDTRLEINQTYESNTNLIYNNSINNETLQYFEFSNITAGFYVLNLSFIDKYENYEIWTVNFTIVSGISISTSYENPVFINKNNTFSISIDSDHSIDEIYYFNSTDYISEYDDDTEDCYAYQFNFTLNYSERTEYNVSVKVVGEYNNSFYVNISKLFFIERTTVLDFRGLKNSYEQDTDLNATITLMDMYLNPIDNKLLNYSIQAPNGSRIINGSAVTNASGEIAVNLDFNITWQLGFYHLNVSFNGTTDYCGMWKMESFELTPIWRSVNSSDINLKVNGQAVSDNFIQIKHNATLNITHADNATFDLSVVFCLNYSQSIHYQDYIDYEYEYLATSDISYLKIKSANITNCPNNFTHLYIDELVSENYTIRYKNVSLHDLIGRSLYDGSGFSASLRYIGQTISRKQLTTAPNTEVDSVEFKEQLRANRSFSYWYYENGLDINDLSIKHLRSGDIISNFENNGSRYYFEKESEENDLFNATVDYNPNWDIDYTIVKNNGTYSKVRIDYKADLGVKNVSILIDFEDLYNGNWTLNATQNQNNFILTIPNINFTTSSQTLYIEGFSSIPYATLPDYESDQNYNRIAMNTKIDYAGFLNYPKFSKLFYINVDPAWTTYNVHYGNEKYSAESLSDSLVKFEGDGFDPSITDSYIHFRTQPFTNVDWNWDKNNDMITITINTSIDVENCFFMYKFETGKAHDLELIRNNTNVFGLSDSGDYEGYLYFSSNLIEAGQTIIKIKIDYVTPLEMFVQGLLIFGIAAALIGAYYYLKKNEETRKELKRFVDKKIVKKLEGDEAEYRDIESIKFEKGKIKGKIKK